MLDFLFSRFSRIKIVLPSPGPERFPQKRAAIRSRVHQVGIYSTHAVRAWLCIQTEVHKYLSTFHRRPLSFEFCLLLFPLVFAPLLVFDLVSRSFTCASLLKTSPLIDSLPLSLDDLAVDCLCTHVLSPTEPRPAPPKFASLDFPRGSGKGIYH